MTEGGTDPGKVCHFPFRYSGEIKTQVPIFIPINTF